jgi:uncharacterized repeat protein (TIGR03803 family)
MNTGKFTLGKLGGRGRICAVFLFCVAATLASQAQTFKTLVNFDESNGVGPVGGLVQGFDGRLYGTTGGGAYKQGTVFQVADGGTLKTLHSFCNALFCPDGANPGAGLTLTADGDFYGSTQFGGNSSCGYGGQGCGTFFKITMDGTLTTLDGLVISNGSFPGGLVQNSNGDFFGIMQTDGAGIYGTVFKLTTEGQLTTLYNFCAQSNCSDGAYPNGLTLGADGALYGTTSEGGVTGCGYQGGNYCGTIFRITQDGRFATIYDFPAGSANGWEPGALIQASDGSLYGSTFTGGANDEGTIFRFAAGKLTTLYNLCSQSDCTDGSDGAIFVQGTDGNFYGTTPGGGGSCGCGTIFSMTPTGALTTLHTFENTDGAEPIGLVQATDGNFYGSTQAGGKSKDAYCAEISGCGTIFRFSTGLAPFVRLLRDAGKEGDCVNLLGQGFEGATGVFLNGTPMTFTVDSDTHIGAHVPAGATSGYVTVDTPSGTLTSNVVFQVKP